MLPLAPARLGASSVTEEIHVSLSRTRELLVGRLRRRKTRERERLFLAEGVRCATTVVRGGAGVRFAIVTAALIDTADGHALSGELAERGIEMVEVDEEQLAALSDTESPQGVMLVCEQPAAALPHLRLRGASRILVLDAVQDPGNVGTLVRVAAAFALDAVVALDGSADPWSAKAVRAAAGSTVTVPLVRATVPELLEALATAGTPLLAAAAGGEPIDRAHRTAGWALAVGNEGAGLRPALLVNAACRVAIPMPGDVDSLNVGVAGALLIYALCETQQRGGTT